MRIGFLFQDGHLRAWHARLTTALRTSPGVDACVASLEAAPGGGGLRATSLESLMLLERTLAGRERSWLADTLRPSELAALSQIDISADATARLGEGDMLLDLRARPDLLPVTPARVLTPTFDALSGEDAMWNRLLEGAAPRLGVADHGAIDAHTLALPALQAPNRLLESAEAVLTHLVAALARYVSTLAAGRTPPLFATTPPPGAAVEPDALPPRLSASAAPTLVRRLTTKLATKRDEILKQAPTWQVAYRAAGMRTLANERLPHELFTLLPDDGQRYYADPFVIAHDSWHHVFIEELPYATGRGVISHFVIDRDGAASQPRIVLEAPHHLSYPQVFRHDGQIWMLPEASAAGRLDLYRAERFPDRWVKHATLIDEPLHDSTFFTHGGRLWISAGMTLPGASTWDTLALYHAERLDGPWTPHPMNPVLVDARAARPAGELYRLRGELWRPAQDCTGGYGSAVTLNRVDALDEMQFRQTLVTTLSFGPTSSARATHTLNYARGIEVIDVFKPRQPQ